ncbi:hypothetical protein [Massilia sp. BKSP1R2A-1]|uniref:hypothetical protein n=1 Tax=Massilia sp. BKSP1R2A-1 TaxID=3422595 RepID=UPI003D34A20C
MEFHAITGKGVAHVCDVHRGPEDLSPLQMISQQELTRLRAAETELAALRRDLAALLHASPLG